MEDGSPTDSPSDIDSLHATLADQASGPGPQDSMVEAPLAADSAAEGHSAPNDAFCEEIIATCCKWHAESVREGFLQKLDGLCPASQAERIAKRAAMSPEIQKAVSIHGTRVLAKYNLTRFICDEGILITALVMYAREFSAARKDLKAILKKAEEIKATN